MIRVVNSALRRQLIFALDFKEIAKSQNQNRKTQINSPKYLN